MNMSSSIEPLVQLSSLPVRWQRLAHPYSLWGRQLAWWALVCGVWRLMVDDGSGWLLVGLAIAVAVWAVRYVPSVKSDQYDSWSAHIISGEYFLATGVPVWSLLQWVAWWLSKGFELLALGVMCFSVWSGAVAGLWVGALWWQVMRYWQRDQLAQLSRWYTTHI